jgi:hypothetical protein
MGADLSPPLFLFLRYSMSIGESVVPPCPFPFYDGMLSHSGPEKGSASPPVV